MKNKETNTIALLLLIWAQRKIRAKQKKTKWKHYLFEAKLAKLLIQFLFSADKISFVLDSIHIIKKLYACRIFNVIDFRYLSLCIGLTLEIVSNRKSKTNWCSQRCRSNKMHWTRNERNQIDSLVCSKKNENRRCIKIASFWKNWINQFEHLKF